MNKLQEIIQHLIEHANNQPNKWHNKRLGRGLTVHIMNDGTAYKLIIARTDTYPSSREWHTITNHWTYPIGKPQCKKGFSKGHYYLMGDIP